MLTGRRFKLENPSLALDVIDGRRVVIPGSRCLALALDSSQEVEEPVSGFRLQLAYYNFRWIHKTLRVTPAMGSNLTDHVWDLAELLA